jgi:hypothetical protein
VVARVPILLAVVAATGCAGASHRAADSTLLASGDNREPPEPTVRSAGASKCGFGETEHIGDLAGAGATFGVTFGTGGGLVAWASPEGPRVRALSTGGAPRGSVRALGSNDELEPFEALPLPNGFAVLERRMAYTAACPPSRCAPTGMRVQFMLTDLDGRAEKSSPETFFALAPPAELTSGSGGSFAFATDHGQVVFVRAAAEDVAPRMRTVAEVAGGYLLVVRGAGPPAFLLATDGGRLSLIDAAGIRHVESGGLGGSYATDVCRLQARWGEDRRIHLAWLSPPSSLTQVAYGVLLTGSHPELQRMGDVSDVDFDGWRPPFDGFVAADPEPDGLVHRYDVLHREVGEPMALRAVDPAAVAESVHVGWTGKAFVIVYAVADGARMELRAVVATC